MSLTIHDNQCDAGERCLMCIETSENVQVKALRQIASYPSGYKFSGVVSDDNPVGRDREEMIHIARSALREADKPTSCCPDCDLDTRDSGPTIPTFDTDWQQAPRLVRRLITEADAEWFWLKGEQAGRIAEQVETQRWLAQVMAGYDERVWDDERER